MLFNSFEFVFGFLPLTVIGFFLISRRGSRPLAIAYLSAASMSFYAWWNVWYLLLILAEVVFNFVLGRQLARSDLAPRARLLLTIFGVGTMLVVLGYFKYTYFILDIIRTSGAAGLVGRQDHPAARHLLLHLSADRLSRRQLPRQDARDRDFVDYALFVTFFPHLIAGPIVHHNEIMPQFASPAWCGCAAPNLTIGPGDLLRRPVQEDRDRRPARRRSRRRCSTPRDGTLLAAARGLGRRARLHAAALLRFLRLFRHGDRPGADVRHRLPRRISIRPTRRPASSISGGAGT